MLYAVENAYAAAVSEWLQSAVIGLNLCPFAKWPFEQGLVRIAVSDATTDKTLLVDLDAEFQHLNETNATQLETTLLVIPHHLADFEQYLDMLAIADMHPWQGVYQIATFHPDYYFEGDAPDAVENFTNRAPFPIFHLLREESLEKSLSRYSNPEDIPERNMKTMRSLSAEQLRQLFKRP